MAKAQDYMGGDTAQKTVYWEGGHRTYFLGWLNNGQSVAKAQDYMGGGHRTENSILGGGDTAHTFLIG